MAANLVTKTKGHAAAMIRFALRAQEEAAKVPRPDLDDGATLQMRIGALGDGRGTDEGGEHDWRLGEIRSGVGSCKWAGVLIQFIEYDGDGGMVQRH